MTAPEAGTNTGADTVTSTNLADTRPRRARRWRAPDFLALVVVLVALVTYFSFSSQYFLTTENLISVIQSIAVTGIIAIPGTMLIIAGEFDLSVGSAVAFTGVVMATLGTHFGLATGVAATLVVGALIGAINGFFVSVVKVNALITTLGTLSVFAGLSEVVSGGQTVIITGFSALGTVQPILDLPIPVLIYIVGSIAGILLMRYTVFGRSVYAIGANRSAARLVGIRSRRIVMFTFVGSGLAAALGGLIFTSRLGAASPTVATGMELSVLTAIVLGGASLTGGRGSIAGTFIGLAIIGVLDNGLVLLNVNSFYQQVASGALLIGAVSFDQLRRRLLRS